MFRYGVESCHHFAQRATNYSEPLFSHTQPLQSVNASPLTSQGCCLCTVLLCHRRLVPLGLCTLIPLSFLGAGPVFSQGSFLCEPAQPLSLSGCHTPSLYTHQIPLPSSVKTSKQKGLQPPLRHIARHPSLWGHKRKEKMQQLNNRPVVSTKALSLMVQGQRRLIHFAWHYIPAWKSGRGYCFQI